MCKQRIPFIFMCVFCFWDEMKRFEIDWDDETWYNITRETVKYGARRSYWQKSRVIYFQQKTERFFKKTKKADKDKDRDRDRDRDKDKDIDKDRGRDKDIRQKPPFISDNRLPSLLRAPPKRKNGIVFDF